MHICSSDISPVPSPLRTQCVLLLCDGPALLSYAVYKTHSTFVWADLAKATAEGDKAGAQRRSRKPNKPPIKRRPATKPAGPKRPAATAAAITSNGSTLIKPAAVTDPNFLLTTSRDQTGEN